MSRRAVWRAWAMATLVSVASSCAPHVAVPPERDFGDLRERFETRLTERMIRGGAMNAGLVMWIEGRGERLPGAQGDLVMAAPDRVRLRVASMFGTALDVGVRGDSLLAWVPAWRTGLRLGSARESLGVREPGGLVYRVLSGNWDPPASAWDRISVRDSLPRLSWEEEEDSLHLELGHEGLPHRVLASRGQATILEATYRAWDRGNGMTWPSQIELVDPRHELRMRLKTSQLRFPPYADTSRLAVRIPAHADVLTLAQLRHVLDRLGVY